MGRDNQTEERTFTVTNLGADKATSVFLLTYSRGIQVTLSYGGMGIPSTFGDSFYAESTDAGSSLSGGFRTDTGCIIDITNKLFKGSLITGNYRFSVTAYRGERIQLLPFAQHGCYEPVQRSR